MLKPISIKEAFELLADRKFSELAYRDIPSAPIYHCDSLATSDIPLRVLLDRQWLRRVEPMRRVFQWGTVPRVDPGRAYDLHINVAEFEGRKIRVIVEEVE